MAPDSELKEGKYQFLQGGITEFPTQPIVQWGDLTWLLSPTALDSLNEPVFTHNASGLLALPIRLIYRPNPKLLALLTKLKAIPKGQSVHKIDFITGENLDAFYPSRSEASRALTSLNIRCSFVPSR